VILPKRTKNIFKHLLGHFKICKLFANSFKKNCISCLEIKIIILLAL